MDPIAVSVASIYECSDCDRRTARSGRCAACGGRLVNLSVARD